MPEIRPFRALRYDRSTVPDLGLVVAPPYDVIGPDEHERLLARHPANVVRLDLPREEQGDEPDDRYRRTARTLAAWRSDGTLHKDPHPSIYVYEQTYRVPGTRRRADPARVLRAAASRGVRAGVGRPPARADAAGRARGPLQAAARDRRQHEPGHRPVRRPAAVGRPVLDAITAAAPTADIERRRRRSPSTLGGARPTATRRPGRAADRGRRRPARSSSPTATTATRPRSATATSDG